MKKLLLIFAAALLCQSCTENQRARKWGGSETVKLEPNQRVVNVTWKQDNMWILTKIDSTAPHKYLFQENSSFGILQGKVIIEEQ